MFTPVFKGRRPQLGAWEVEKSREVSNLRIHVERVIGCVKNKFSIFSSPIPVSFLRSEEDRLGREDCMLNKMVRVCCAVVNLCPSIVDKDRVV